MGNYGHFLQWEALDEVNRELISFLSEQRLAPARLTLEVIIQAGRPRRQPFPPRGAGLKMESGRLAL